MNHHPLMSRPAPARPDSRPIALALALALSAACACAAPVPAPWRQEDFASELYRQAAAAQGARENVVVSPWGVANLFAMLQTGARGDTARGMAFALQLGGAEPPSPEETAATFLAARENLARVANENVALELSDSLWLAPGFQLKPDFTALARKAFDAETRTTPMGAEGRKAINAFVSEKTHGRIAELLSPPLLDNPLTRLVAVDTIYLKAKWETSFEESDTKEQVFRAPSGKVKVPFMHSTRQAVILDSPECSALLLPYSFRSAEMLVILPAENKTIADVESRLSGPWLDRLYADQWSGEVKIAMPKFEFDSSHDLAPILVPMGMGAAFDPAADFSGIAGSPGELYIGAAIQKAKIIVDESGTEAAAATAAVMLTKSIGPRELPSRAFVADRPFLFLIRDTRTGLILFLGRVCKP